MAEANNFTFSHREVAELLVRSLDLHEGYWGISIEFGLGATNIPRGPDTEDLAPAAILPVLSIGIHRFPKPNSLTVDAAQVNPIKAPSTPRKVKVRLVAKKKQSV